MSATDGKIEYRYRVGSFDNVTRLYIYTVVAEMPAGLMRLSAGGAEFHTTGTYEFKRTKKEAWVAAAKETEAELAECAKEYKDILKRLGVLERRLKIQQEKAK